MPGNRDPYQFPRYENDLNFTGIKESQKPPFKKPTHLAQNDEPWSRLNDTATFSSMRRSVLHHDEFAPKDSLDLHLRSVYDNHADLLLNKNQTVLQRETLMDRRGKHNESDEPEKEPLRVWVNPQKASIFSIEGSIGEKQIQPSILHNFNKHTLIICSYFQSLPTKRLQTEATPENTTVAFTQHEKLKLQK
uniref:Si:ch211-163l21.7 n=1 Tax=Astyanax mexicanus TaxID=7994 RepID=A0A3B1JX61_ASTMX